MRNLLLFSALCVGVSAAARADSVFSLLNVSLDSGAIVTGSVSINTVTGVVDKESISFSQGSTAYVFSGTPTASSVPPNTEYDIGILDSAGDSFALILPVGSLVGYTGGSLCSTGNDQCGGDFSGFLSADQNTQYLATGGSLGMTPEPSSVILLGTGLLAAVGGLRRRVSLRGV